MLARGLGAYAYFVESKKDLTEPAAEEGSSSVDAGKIDEIESSRIGRRDDGQAQRADWQIASPAGLEPGEQITGLASVERSKRRSRGRQPNR